MRTYMLGTACLVLAACYSPEIRDCTVTCTASTDCADDQVYGSDQFCASPAVANECETMGSGSSAMKITLRVTVQGLGKVVVKDVGECLAAHNAPGDCTWQLPVGTRVELEAIAGEFDKWLTSLCTEHEQSCAFTPASSTIVGAKFRSSGGDD